MKIIGLGSALVDLLVRIEEDDVLDKLKFPKGSMQLQSDEEYRRLCAFVADESFLEVPGGAACNTIRALAHLNNKVGFIGKVGTDFHAEMYRNELELLHVEANLIPDGRKPTGVATTFVSKDGERTFGTYLGASMLLNADEIRSEVFDGYDCFYIEGYMLVNYPLMLRTAEIAKEKGIKYAIDLGSYNMVHEHIGFLKPFVRDYVDILFANEEEALAYTGKCAEEALTEFAKEVDVCVVKVGSRGALIKCGNEDISVPALPVKPVDTTGAGDFFAAGFLHGCCQGWSLDLCGKAGSLLASYVIREIGPNLPDNVWEEIKKQIKQF
ncbi:MAG: adenosine kinase [Bacteroidales bacterium]|nr:adenosine kinase [Bacteroidales bacterium]